ncbi:hypothetical protein [Martelella limonii]|uniref:hypothetical protein n=1 Tax=Martelella limonii TaxID=1647649 RepID=UPI00157FF881|nr:hypothetical protein [Martelella limonii]
MEEKAKGTRKAGRILLWSVAAIAVIAAAGAVGGKVMLEKTVADSIAKSGATAASVKADLIGHVHVTDLTLPIEEGQSLHVASVEARPEFLFLTGMIEASDLSFKSELYDVTVPNLKVENAGLNREFLAAMDENSALTPAERVERISAGQITIPQIDAKQNIEGIAQTTTYSDVVLKDIVNGHVGSYAAGEMRAQVTPPTGEDAPALPLSTTISIESIEGQDIDGPFLARIYTETSAGEDKNEPRLVYGPVSAKNFVMTMDEESISYGALKSSGFWMRLPEVPFFETVQALQESAQTQDMTDEQKQRLGLQVLSLIDTISKGDMEVSDMRVTSSEEPDMSFKIDRMAVAMDELVFDTEVEGVDIRAGDDFFTLQKATSSGFSFVPTMEAVRALIEAGPEGQDRLEVSAFMPAFGTITMTDYAVSATPDTENGFGVDETLEMSLKDFSVVFDEPFKGIPTGIHFAMDQLKIKLTDEKNEAVQIFRKMGYEEVTMSENIALRWDRAEKQLAIEDITLSGEDIGSISLAATIGNFGEEFFSGDKDLVQAAAFALTVHEISMELENDGLFSRALKLYADDKGISEGDAASIVALTLSVAAESLGDDQTILPVIDAVSAFIADPKTLAIAIKAKSDQGIGMPALMTAAMAPASLLQQVDISASAE